MKSGVIPSNIHTIRGSPLFPIICRWRFLCRDQPWMIAFGPDHLDVAPRSTTGWMTAEECRFILWGLKERWSAARIGRALGVNEATVRRFRRSFWGDPERLLELGLFEMVGRAKNQEFKCLVCEEKVESKSKTERHVFSHFLEEAAVEYAMEGREEKAMKEEEEEDALDWLQPALDVEDSR